MPTEEFLSFLNDDSEARLFPVGKDTNKERGITSIFLACLSVVEGYSTSVLKSLGRKTGTRSKLECFTEITVPKEKGSDRPDGLMLIKQGKKVIWSALIETKVGSAELKSDQVERYLQLARHYKVDALITISNQFCALPTHHPLKITKKLTRSVKLFHWSWIYLKTQADFQLRVEDDIDPEQKYILSEMVRYFDDPSSGVVDFHSMNKEWKDVCMAIRRKDTLKKASDEIINTVSAWHQELRDIVLKLTGVLGRSVSIKLSKDHKDNPENRLKDGCATLCESKMLCSEIIIPDAASNLKVVVDIAHRTVECSMELCAPSDKQQKTKTRVNWLLRQLAKVDDDNVSVEAKWSGATKPTQAGLKLLREDPLRIQSDNPKQLPNWLLVKTSHDLAGRFSGRKTFIEDVEKTVSQFYTNIGQKLLAYQPPAPKMDAKPEDNRLVENVLE